MGGRKLMRHVGGASAATERCIHNRTDCTTSLYVNVLQYYKRILMVIFRQFAALSKAWAPAAAGAVEPETQRCSEL